ncbi:MAG: NAD(P)H-hydrate dehydratase [Nanoarchaeota archaeon]|nr:NAD(P)H-hydrate dehydratase [Nanoarchaeota archaeon]
MKYITKKDLVLKKRRPDSHKGDNGRLLIIGGSADYVGAPALAAMAALRSGCDIAVIAAPEKVAWQINSFSPDLITKKIKGDSFDLIHSTALVKEAERFDAILIGNGMGTEPGTAKFVCRFVKALIEIEKPLILDADAIKILGHDKHLLKEANRILFTPHKKEFEILSGENLPIVFEDSVEAAKNFIQKINGNNVVLLKGRIDIIASKQNTLFNQTGNEGMTVGGTGDVLAGIAASLVAQKNDLFNSACAAAYVNGLVGDQLMKRQGIGFTASDMVPLIPQVINKIR